MLSAVNVYQNSPSGVPETPVRGTKNGHEDYQNRYPLKTTKTKNLRQEAKRPDKGTGTGGLARVDWMRLHGGLTGDDPLKNLPRNNKPK